MADKQQPQPAWSKKKRAPAMYAQKRGPRGEACTGRGDFGAISKDPRTGKYYRTRHHDHEKAQKRLDGQRWHVQKTIVDLTKEGALSLYGFSKGGVNMPNKDQVKKAAEKLEWERV